MLEPLLDGCDGIALGAQPPLGHGEPVPGQSKGGILTGCLAEPADGVGPSPLVERDLTGGLSKISRPFIQGYRVYGAPEATALVMLSALEKTRIGEALIDPPEKRWTFEEMVVKGKDLNFRFEGVHNKPVTPILDICVAAAARVAPPTL